ncbi:hypothetical protein AI28_05985 [bacteria symbiont BFo1 of Frankliniella occidentalis]|nr:hypothetical protein AI28_05985 [bacteria symbiont BFo1 of Frankliniella occidentalis]
MPSGTIALTNNSTTVGGTGTAFTTELKAGDFIGVTVGGAPYTMIVASIASNTQLTIAQAYNGPTASGLAWYGVPSTLKYAITQQVLNDMATNQRGMIAQLANWQKIYSDAASVTVERPDRSSFTGPSWGYMANQYTTKVDKSELGTAAFRDVQTSLSDATSGRAMLNGAFGFGGVPPYVSNAAILPTGACSIFGYSGSNTDPDYTTRSGAGINMGNGAGYIMQVYVAAGGANLMARVVNQSTGNRSFNTLWGTANTTVDTNNFIKRASPIARLTNDISKMQDDFAVENQHKIAGLVSVNAEAEGVSAEKVSTGIYQVTGAVGLADEGWTLEVPQDINGNRLCFVELATDKEGVITVSVFKRRFDVDSAMIVAGEPMDIPEGRWIDLRLQMPEDSAWNTRMREMPQAAESEEETS